MYVIKKVRSLNQGYLYLYELITVTMETIVKQNKNCK